MLGASLARRLIVGATVGTVVAAAVTVLRCLLAASALVPVGLWPHAGAMAAAVPASHGVPLGPEEQAWRKAHPIPDYMDRWSRRWQSGETNKEHVRDILTDVSARRDWPVGSAEQLSGDFYAACMDDSAIDALGVKPRHQIPNVE